jgi:hypothetical protein
MASVKYSSDVLAEYGVNPRQHILYFFDIDLTVIPIDAPMPATPPTPATPPPRRRPACLCWYPYHPGVTIRSSNDAYRVGGGGPGHGHGDRGDRSGGI